MANKLLRFLRWQIPILPQFWHLVKMGSLGISLVVHWQCTQSKSIGKILDSTETGIGTSFQEPLGLAAGRFSQSTIKENWDWACVYLQQNCNFLPQVNLDKLLLVPGRIKHNQYNNYMRYTFLPSLFPFHIRTKISLPIKDISVLKP